MREDYRIGDPVMDAAQGRAMVVVSPPTETVAEWSDRENYDLLSNYANSKFDPTPEEPAVECVYVSDVRSEPSKTYTFPASRLRLIDVHHADDGRRLADRVIAALVEELLVSCLKRGERHEAEWLTTRLAHLGVDSDIISESKELLDIEETLPPEQDTP